MKPVADNGTAAKARTAPKPTATPRSPAGAATKQSSPSAEKGESRTRSDAPRPEAENVTLVGAETPLSTKRRKDASKGIQQEAKSRGSAKTTVVTKVDVGFGNSLFIRGSGGGLSWEQGQPLECTSDDEWIWQSSNGKDPIEFKLLINDNTWSQGENFSAAPGQKMVCHPTF
jgi:hypothetical protein